MAWDKVQFMTDLYRVSLQEARGANRGLARLQRRMKKLKAERLTEAGL